VLRQYSDHRTNYRSDVQDPRHEGACLFLADGVDIPPSSRCSAMRAFSKQRYLNVTDEDEELRNALEVSWTRPRAMRLTLAYALGQLA
jgi:hypothetical protein